MASTLRELASNACDQAFQQEVVNATNVLMNNLVAGGSEADQVNDSKDKYQKALALCKQTHEMAAAVLGAVFT